MSKSVNDDIQRLRNDLRARKHLSSDQVGWSAKYYLEYKIEGSIWRRYGVGFDDSGYARQMLDVHRCHDENKYRLITPVHNIQWRLVIEKSEWCVVD